MCNSFSTPFSFLFEHPKAPFARILRTSTTQKIYDSLRVLIGGVYDDFDRNDLRVSNFMQLFEPEFFSDYLPKMNCGLFDVLLLGIPLGVTWCLANVLSEISGILRREGHENTEKNSLCMIHGLMYYLALFLEKILKVIYVLWNVFVNVVLRLLFGVTVVFLLSVSVSLFVAYIVDCFAQPVKQKAFKIEGFESTAQHIVESNLQQFFVNQNSVSREMLDNEGYRTKVDMLSLEYIESNRGDCSQSSARSQSSEYYIIEHQKIKTHRFYIPIRQTSTPAFDALRQLNFARINDACDQSENKSI